jgi:hypothetical protein
MFAYLGDSIAINLEVCIGMRLLRFKNLFYGDWPNSVFAISLRRLCQLASSTTALQAHSSLLRRTALRFTTDKTAAVRCALSTIRGGIIAVIVVI